MRPVAPAFEFLPVRGGRPIKRAAAGPWLRLTRALTVSAFALLALGCTGPMTPHGKATEATREFNEAARWNRMDVVLERSAPEDRQAFLKRHQKWHKSIRILETEVVGLQLSDATNATVQVDVDWTSDDETNLKSTRLEQTWEDVEGKWIMKKERRIAGDLGLFGEKTKEKKKKKNTHFPTQVIH